MVLVAVGSRPETGLARSAGIETGVKGAICVNRRMETSIPDIYAAGDCAETYHRLLGKNTYLPLGTTAHKQGRIAGENAVGGNREYAGTLGTQSVKIFNLVAARTGLKDDEALKEGFSPLSVDIETWDHKIYYPHAEKMRIRITGDQKTGKLLGAQIIGAYGTEVSKRIDTVAAAIHNGMTVESLNDLDLSYTPPLSSPWDPVQMAAQAWSQANRRAERRRIFIGIVTTRRYQTTNSTSQHANGAETKKGISMSRVLHVLTKQIRPHSYYCLGNLGLPWIKMLLQT